MKQYLELCQHILEEGKVREDRTGTGTIGVFGYQMRFDLSEGFPLLTTKAMDGVRLDGIIHELLWFLKGDTNIKYLVDRGVNIWNADAYRVYKNCTNAPMNYKEFVELIKTNESFAIAYGNLGSVYGKQWRSWETHETYETAYDMEYKKVTIDQISKVIQGIKEDPYGRRHIVSAWNVAELSRMALPPCHVLFQFYVSDGKLSCQLYQRSGDVFLGVPYNIASYALLTMMIADQCGLGYGEFIHTLGDAHIYKNHIPQVILQLSRKPHKLPKMEIKKAEDIFSYTRNHFSLTGYNAYPPIKGQVSVGD